MPSAPPARARSRLSPNIMRTSRRRLAPSARRSASSRSRSTSRASKSSATLPQPIRRRKPEPTSIVSNPPRIGARQRSPIGSSVAPSFAFSVGCAAARPRKIEFTSLSACASRHAGFEPAERERRDGSRDRELSWDVVLLLREPVVSALAFSDAKVAFRHHADDHRRTGASRNGSAEERAIGPEAGSPKPLREDNRARRRAGIFLRR